METEITNWIEDYFDSLWDEFVDDVILNQYVDYILILDNVDDDINRQLFLEELYPDEWEEFCTKQYYIAIGR